MIDGWISLGYTDPNCDQRCTYQDVPCHYRRCEKPLPHTHKELVHIEVDHPEPWVLTYEPE